MDIGGELATLSDETLAALDRGLPPTWSHANPVDIIGDAPAGRYGAALKAVAADTNVDAVLVLNCPTALASPLDAASGVAAVVDKVGSGGRIEGKPVLACWLGEHTAEPARKVLRDAGVATFETPAEAASAIGYLDGWSKAQAALSQVPASGSADIEGRIDEVRAIFRGGRPLHPDRAGGEVGAGRL
jgi:acetyltransferase